MLPVLRTNPFAFTSPVAASPANRLDSFFDRVLGGDDGFLSASFSRMPMAMWDDEDHIYVEAELPGVTDENVDVTVHNGVLFIRGELKPEEGRKYLYNGRTYGRFERSIVLPESVTVDGVQANLTNGLLHIALPKSPEAKPRKITLRSS